MVRRNIISILKTKKEMPNVCKFRPISLTSNIGRIMELIITKRFYKVYKNNNCFPEYQKEFRKGQSTSYNIVETQQKIHNTFEQKQEMIAVFLDINKTHISFKC